MNKTFILNIFIRIIHIPFIINNIRYLAYKSNTIYVEFYNSYVNVYDMYIYIWALSRMDNGMVYTYTINIKLDNTFMYYI